MRAQKRDEMFLNAKTGDFLLRLPLDSTCNKLDRFIFPSSRTSAKYNFTCTTFRCTTRHAGAEIALPHGSAGHPRDSDRLTLGPPTSFDHTRFTPSS